VPRYLGTTPYFSSKALTLFIEELYVEMETREKQLIEQALREKEVLLKEIHHRVKNNLQLISSLLQLQTGKFTDPEVIRSLEEGQGRIKSMAVIHQMLYENEDISSISIDQYFGKLSQNIRISFGEMAEKVTVNLKPSGLMVNIDTAVPVGLITNELLYNCFKYAFIGKDTGEINLTVVELEPEKYLLTISDDGNGLPPNFEETSKTSLGMRLVRMLAMQLDGNVEFITDGIGTTAKVSFCLENGE
jgi:two-component sensor histidine kinase